MKLVGVVVAVGWLVVVVGGSCTDFSSCTSCFGDEASCKWCNAGIEINDRWFYIDAGSCVAVGTTCPNLGNLGSLFSFSLNGVSAQYVGREADVRDGYMCDSADDYLNYGNCEECVQNSGEWCSYNITDTDYVYAAGAGSCSKRCVDWGIESLSFAASISSTSEECSNQPSSGASRMSLAGSGILFVFTVLAQLGEFVVLSA